MSRQLYIAVITLLCGGTLTFSQETTTPQDGPGRYTTIATVIRVAEDIDQYLDAEDDSFPAFQEESLRLSNESEFLGLDTGDFELSSSNWFSQYDVNRRDDLTPPLEEPRYSFNSNTEIDLHVDELIALPTRTDLQVEQRQLSWSDWQQPGESRLWSAVEETQAATASLGVPVIAATAKPTSNMSQNAGLWMFLGLMIAPFAWLGWVEYKDLVARTYRAELQEEAGIDSQLTTASEGEPCETKSRFMEAARERELEEAGERFDEEIEFTEISSESDEEIAEELSAELVEDDCEYELGVLEEANSLLASVGTFKKDVAEESQPAETVESEADTSLANEFDSQADDSFGDLTVLRGIGPATRDYLVRKGICNLNDLVETDAGEIQSLLDEAGTRFQAAQPKKWVEQARGMLSTS